jgi:hypothetical protein
MIVESLKELEKLTHLKNSIITLSNGKRVGNFSSPHSFTFEDGSVLPKVSDAESERLCVTFIEVPVEDGQPGDIELKFEISQSVLFEMSYWQSLFLNNLVDVVFCPLPMIKTLKDQGKDLKNTPFRAIRMVSRTDKRVSIEKQCS